VDAYYPQAGLVIEYHESQHAGLVPFFDRRHTVSGVDRGRQRRVYDKRREQEVRGRSLRLVVIRPDHLDADYRGRLLRNRSADLAQIRRLLHIAS
jgi:hypothetical protein